MGKAKDWVEKNYPNEKGIKSLLIIAYGAGLDEGLREAQEIIYSGEIMVTDAELLEMKIAFEAFRQGHTLDNRTPREMFYNGYYSALVARKTCPDITQIITHIITSGTVPDSVTSPDPDVAVIKARRDVEIFTESGTTENA